MIRPVNLIGERFGRLVVVARAENGENERVRWLCKCDCGNEKIASDKSLRNGHTQSCGCLAKGYASEHFLKDRVGERFGHLIVESRAADYIAPSGAKHVRWKCKCDCGNETIVDVCQLVGGKTKSCGCLHEARLRSGNKKHGGAHDRLYRVYANIKRRCYNPSGSDYKYYGGRGIKMCQEWLESYPLFREWAYQNGYNEDAPWGECTIDRINVNGDYEPSNCRWVSMSVQSKNRRRNVISKN